MHVLLPEPLLWLLSLRTLQLFIMRFTMDCENQAIQYQVGYNVILIIDPYIARDRYGIVFNKTNRDFNENAVVDTIPPFYQ